MATTNRTPRRSANGRIVLICAAMVGTMTGAAFAAVAAAAVVGGGSSPAPPAPRADRALELRGARLGMALEDWRRAPFPGARNPHVTAACSSQAPPGRPGLTRASASPDRTLEVCSYVSRYGPSAVLTEDLPWTDDLLAKSPSYVFTDGRLSSIRFRVGIDAFDRVMARLKSTYGPPTRLDHDDIRTRVGPLPRADVRWDLGSQTIELVDPADDLTNMTIIFSVRTPAAGIPGAKTATE